jgi:BirA family biotin operon repressor/biotin-[acetyl-CoA-carboxylase] ligase
MADEKWLGTRRVELGCCGSTLDEAAELAREGAVHGTVVIAEEQTTGRGRQGRKWLSPRGVNLYSAWLLRPPISPADVPPITLTTGLAVREAVNIFGVEASLKWPNDVFVGSRKLAGILTEMTTRGSNIETVIVGIGVNLDQRTFDPEIADIATSIALECDQPVDRAAFVDALLDSGQRWLDRFFTGGVAAVAEEWWRASNVADQTVTFEERGERMEGQAVRLDQSGALVVELADGTERVVTAGDVNLQR